MKKRIFSLLLAAAMLLPAAVLSAHAAPPDAGETYSPPADVAEDAWYADAVRWAIREDIAQPLSDGRFGVGLDVRAGEAIVMLWRACGSPEPVRQPEAQRPYAEALEWFWERTGISFSEVDAETPADRAAFVRYLYLACGQGEPCGNDGDFSALSPHAAAAVRWAAACGVINASCTEDFFPHRHVTREQAAVMLWRRFRETPEAAVAERRSVPVFRETDTDETIELLFYEDLPHVAYVALGDYYRLFFPESAIRSVKLRAGRYVLTCPTGAATVDTREETLFSPDLPSFTNLMILTQDGMDNVYLDGMPYVRFAGCRAAPAFADVTLAFGGYGIDLRAENGVVYFPIATLCDLYSDLCYHFAFFSGEKVYVENETQLPSPAERDAADYRRAVLDNLTGRGDAPDLAAFNYSELCFAVDCFYGNPRRTAPLYTLFNRYRRLDDALDAYRFGGEPVGARVRDLLLSPDAADYLLGLECLGMLLDDGGHTVIRPSEALSAFVDERAQALLSARASRLAVPENAVLAELLDRAAGESLDRLALRRSMARLRAESYGPDGSYFVQGDTAVCVLDSFNPGSYDLMRAYDAQEAARRAVDIRSGDPIALFLNALRRAKADPAVRNFVLDLSLNGGGSLDVVMAMVSLMMGADENEVAWKNSLTGQTVRAAYQIDRNFDGAFDETDRAEDFSGLNFAILTSEQSFSCANLLAALVKDRGVLILGERSGGGACAIQKMASADGLLYQLSSSRATLVDRTGQSIDGGVAVDVNLLGKDESGLLRTVEIQRQDLSGPLMKTVVIRDYTNFYNIERLSGAIAGYREKKSAA